MDVTAEIIQEEETAKDTSEPNVQASVVIDVAGIDRVKDLGLLLISGVADLSNNANNCWLNASVQALAAVINDDVWQQLKQEGCKTYKL